MTVVVFSILTLLLVVTSLQSLAGAIRFRRYFARRLAEVGPGPRPFASVIVPCRGAEEGLKANLEALFKQQYPDYEVIFVTGNEADACVPTLSGFLGSRGARIVFAGEARGESQKVRNLRVATKEISSRSEVLVFMDSDARPSVQWLSSLVDALGGEGIGASTGYRWFVPASRGLAAELRSSWNASVASRLSEDASGNFCWGGSTAIRRDVFERLHIGEIWEGVLSDDYAVMRTLRREGLGIEFAPGAMTATLEDCSFRELLEFTTRQMKITRVYAPKLWVSGLIGAALFNLTVVWGILNLALGTGVGRWVAAAGLSLVWGLGVGKAFVRLRAVAESLPDHGAEIRRQTLPQTVLWVFTPAIFLLNCIVAWFSRDIVWRGIRYRMVSPEKTVTLDR